MNLTNLTQQSLDQHHEMLSLLEQIRQNLQNHTYGSIARFNEEFSALQKSSRLTDSKLLRALDSETPDEATAEMLQLRRELQKSILLLLQQTLPKANTMKTLLKSEMQAVTKGRTALCGYRNVQENHGRIVSSRC